MYHKQQEMYRSIKNIVKILNLSKPDIITNPNGVDMLIEKDLRGLDLSDITDKNTIKQLSADLTVFNDCAFRYYALQFMSYYFLSYEYLFLELFILAYIKTDGLLMENSYRFVQFENSEVNAIIGFFKYLEYETNILRKRFEKVDLENAISKNSILDKLGCHYLDLLDCEQNIREVLCFWKEHPSFKTNKNK